MDHPFSRATRYGRLWITRCDEGCSVDALHWNDSCCNVFHVQETLKFLRNGVSANEADQMVSYLGVQRAFHLEREQNRVFSRLLKSCLSESWQFARCLDGSFFFDSRRFSLIP